MKSGNLVWTTVVMGIILLVASAVSQGIKMQNEKVTLESRMAALENKVASLEIEIVNLEKRITNPPVKIIPCK